MRENERAFAEPNEEPLVVVAFFRHAFDVAILDLGVVHHADLVAARLIASVGVGARPIIAVTAITSAVAAAITAIAAAAISAIAPAVAAAITTTITTTITSAIATTITSAIATTTIAFCSVSRQCVEGFEFGDDRADEIHAKAQRQSHERGRKAHFDLPFCVGAAPTRLGNVARIPVRRCKNLNLALRKG